MTQAPPSPPPIVAVASGKGGVGKTWLSITLAHTLANLGQKTLLFDGDLGLANVDIQLGFRAKADLGSVIAGRASLGQAATAYKAGGFDIIAGRSGSGSLSSLSAQRIEALGEQVRDVARRYDRAILDLGAGVEATVRRLIGPAGTVLVVTTDEPTALTDAYAFIKVMIMRKLRMDLRIVVNMAGSSREGEKTYRTLVKACENFLKISPPLAGIVRRDPKVRDAIRSQTPLLIRHPDCAAAADVETIARGLIHRV